METLIVKVKAQEEIEKEIALPYYSHSDFDWHMVISKDKTVDIWINGISARISTHVLESCVTEAAGKPQITEAEFAEAFQRALYLLSVDAPLLTHVDYPLPEPATTDESFINGDLLP